ncbi:ammonium transporter AmtB-like domain-containing protein [Pavlovales sp. CCMP2436]|nr:ammonium transporter AmtB-like domain-containing protein [Pavlovales sp. CCMP2436]
MQTGFAMLEAGSVRAKNTKNILIKNLLDASIGAIVWYVIGFGIAYGGDNGFIGTSGSTYAIHSYDWQATYTSEGYDWATWFFSSTFAVVAVTIVSGGVAERCTLTGYVIYSLALTAFIYPIIVHLVWDSAGFLSAFNADGLLGGVVDFAGSGVVHMTGGVTALFAAYFLGPRIGRFDEAGRMQPMPGHSSVLQVLGTFILWLGWYGFTGGSTLSVFTSQYSSDLARVCVNTTLSAAAGALTVILLAKVVSHVWDVAAVCNGVLAGLVGITASCVVVDPWAAIIIGVLSGFVYMAAVKLEAKLKIDDPLDSFPVHGACGMWGVLASGVFCRPEYTYNQVGSYGFIYGGEKGDLLGIQVIFIVIHFIWVGGLTSILSIAMKRAGVLRVSAEIEEMGMDLSKHGGEAYFDVAHKSKATA